MGPEWAVEEAHNWMAVGFRATDDVRHPGVKKWARGMALFGVGVTVAVAAVVFASRPTTPPTAHAPGWLEPQSGVSVAAGASSGVPPPALTPAVADPAAAMVVQTLASRGPVAPEPAPPALAPSPASTAPDIAATAARVAVTPAAPVATAASTDVPAIVVPAVQAPPPPGPAPALALAAAFPETTAPATPVTAPVVPAPAVAPPPAAAASAATTANAPVAAVAAVVPVREVETRAIQSVLGRYRDAFNTLDARGAFAVWPGVNERYLARAFERLEEQQLSFDQCRIDVGGAMAEAAWTGHRAVRPAGRQPDWQGRSEGMAVPVPQKRVRVGHRSGSGALSRPLSPVPVSHLPSPRPA